MVMIEAMACGTPVLAFPEGAAPEVVDDGVTGSLVHYDPDDSAGYQARIAAAVNALSPTAGAFGFS